MMKRFLTASAVMLALFSTTSARAAFINDPNFTTAATFAGIGANGAAYLSTPFGTSTAVPNSYNFSNGYAGVASGTGFGLANSPTPGGDAGFSQAISGRVGGTISQTFAITTAGVYNVSFMEENRAGYGIANYDATLGGLDLTGAASTTGFSMVSGNVTLAVGTYSLVLSTLGGTGTGGDYTTFFTGVNVAAVPEPASIAMLGVGLIASAGFAARKARRNRN